MNSLMETIKNILHRTNITEHMDKDGYQTVLLNPIVAAERYPEKNIEERMEDVGFNTGNLLFGMGIKEQLIISREMWYKGKITGVDKPACIMPSSNFIIQGDDDILVDACMELLNETDCPVTLAGLGAQSSKELDTPSKLMEKVSSRKKAYFKAVAERAVSLGVRGEFTAECLEILGIHNYRIIGCPSFYKYRNGVFPILPKPNLKRTQFTVTTGSPVETKILETGMKLKSIWLMQMMTEMPDCAFEGKNVSEDMMMRRFPGLKVGVKELTDFMRKNARFYFELKKWDNFYQEEKITFSFGSRFHGNMCALRNGVPALWITHDSRTEELTKALYLPNITAEEFAKIDDPKKMLKYCDYSDLYKNYEKLCRNYVEFLEENHISHRFTLKEK